MILDELAARFRVVGDAFLQYFGRKSFARRQPVKNKEQLERFIDTRASHVAQTALYGYLKTRAGTQFPALFENDAFVVSVNIAKWQIWLACVADLRVYAGGRLCANSGAGADRVAAVMVSALDGILDKTGVPVTLASDLGHSPKRFGSASLRARGLV